MRFRTKRRKQDEQWRTWFAWYPVKLETGGTVWLERVARRRGFLSGEWYYVALIK